MKFSHVNMTARNANHLADFYKSVFGCVDVCPRKSMSGDALSRGNGVPNSELFAAWLSLPGVDGPFLEIFEYKNARDCAPPPVNQPGYGHISFEIEDIHATFDAVLAAGGSCQGEITSFGGSENPFLFVYMRDPEGNVIELEQY